MAEAPIILASQSPRRKDLLGRIVPTFSIITVDTEEEHHEECSPEELCLTNAKEKAWAVAKDHPEATVIGSDTLVFLGTKPLGKPLTEEEAVSTLKMLSGKEHSVCTAVAIYSPKGNLFFTDTSFVGFKTLTDATIVEYMGLVHVMDKAGSYACQEHGDLIIDHIRGDFDTVVGFPTKKVAEALKSLGHEILD